MADFWGEGSEHVIVNELPLEHRGKKSAVSKVHILDVKQIFDSNPLETFNAGIQTIETDPVNYSYPLIRTIDGSNAEEVLAMTYPSKWTSKSRRAAFNESGAVRLARIYGNTETAKVEIEYLRSVPTKHKIWHLVESKLYSDILLARTLKNGKELEVRDIKGKILNRWKLGRDHIGVERILLYHEFPINDCDHEQHTECFRTVVVLTNDWFSCKTSAALFAGRTDRCPTKILELRQDGNWSELHAIRFEEPHYSIFSAHTVLNDGRVVFATQAHIYAISLE